MPDLSGCGLIEQVVDSKVANQFEVSPVVERIPQSPRNGSRPRNELFIGFRVAAAVFLGDSVGTHCPPLVVVAVEPYLREIAKSPVFGDIGGRKMTVKVEYRYGSGVLAVQM